MTGRYTTMRGGLRYDIEYDVESGVYVATFRDAIASSATETGACAAAMHNFLGERFEPRHQTPNSIPRPDRDSNLLLWFTDDVVVVESTRRPYQEQVRLYKPTVGDVARACELLGATLPILSGGGE